LFDYINGAAELYLSYDFVELETVSYEGEEGRFLTIDLYRHRDAKKGFGIYSRERPQEDIFLSIGGQGYYQNGILNFVKGEYYVKLSSFGLDDKDGSFLKGVAQEVARLLDSEGTLPAPLSWFPEEGKVEHSERYINRDFLGHGFLSDAFIADYEFESSTTQAFIIEADSEDAAKEMLSNYLELAGEDSVEDEARNGSVRFEDPFNHSSGKLSIRWHQNYILGFFSDDSCVAGTALDLIEESMIEGLGRKIPVLGRQFPPEH